MTYNIIFCDDFIQVVPAVIIDARSTTLPPGIDGNAVQQFIDAAMSKINSNTLTYKIETSNGNLVGYFTLQVNPADKTCVRASQVLRQAFISLTPQVTIATDNFITSSQWQNDYLF